MRKVLKSYGRALLVQFNFKMLFLSLLPSLLALGLWAVILYFSLQRIFDFLQENFVSSDSYQLVAKILTFLGLLALKAFIVPLIAMWLLLPIMLTTALIFVAWFAMPQVSREISRRYFPALEKKHGASWLSSVGFDMVSLVAFLFCWLISLPLSLFFNLGLFLQPVLIGWFTYRVMAYGVLARHASVEERKTIMREHRWQLWTVGVVTGLLSSLPGMVWLGGVMWLYALPLFAPIAVWLFVLVFMFSGIWFQLFCLDSLQYLREENEGTANPGLQPEIAS